MMKFLKNAVAIIVMLTLSAVVAFADEDVNLCKHKAGLMQAFEECYKKTREGSYSFERDQCVDGMLSIIDGKDCTALKEQYRTARDRLKEEQDKRKM